MPDRLDAIREQIDNMHFVDAEQKLLFERLLEELRYLRSCVDEIDHWRGKGGS